MYRAREPLIIGANKNQRKIIHEAPEQHTWTTTTEISHSVLCAHSSEHSNVKLQNFYQGKKHLMYYIIIIIIYIYIYIYI